MQRRQFNLLRFWSILFFYPLLFTVLSSAEEAKSRGRFPDKMTVTVVDEDGKPIPHAEGRYRFGNYVNFKVDKNGVFVAEMASEEQRKKRPTADFTVKAEGYGPFQAMFGSDLIIPDTFRVVLKPAQKIGGIVVDENGKPVEDVEVGLSIRFETFYKTDDIFVASAETKTDAEGKWSLFQLPATFNGSPSLSLKKDGYLHTPISDIPASRLNPDADGRFHEKMVIERGYAFSGTVVDESNIPIEGATVTLENWNQLGEPAQTDKDGKFCIENLALTNRALLVASAPGKAASVQLVEIRSKEEPVTIVLHPGRSVEFTAKDSAGKPISEATIGLIDIDNQSGGHVRISTPLLKDAKTDAEGRFIWKEAPVTPFEISCYKQDYVDIQRKINATETEIPLVLYRSKVILRVLDDETGEPVSNFSVITRMYNNPDDERFSEWMQPESGSNGEKEMRIYGGNEKKAWRFDVQAPGREMTASRKIVLGEEDAEMIVRLPKAASADVDVEESLGNQMSDKRLFPLSGGSILSPDGKEANNATVEVFVPENICGPNAEPVYSDENGEFLLSDDQISMIGPQPFVLKITHPSGVAVVDGEEFRRLHDKRKNKDAGPIRLTKWGRIEGALQAGTKKLEGTGIAARWTKPDSLAASPGFYWGTGTKKDGRFVIEQVMPGRINLTRTVPARGISSAWSSYCGSIEVNSGETTFCTIGGTGRAVIGKAVLPKNGNTATIDFRQYTARIVPMPENPDDLIGPELPKEYWPNPEPEKREACNVKRLAWYQTQEGKQYKEQSERYSRATSILRFTVLNAEGRFHFDDLPDGDYALVVSKTDNCNLDFSLGDWHLKESFTVDSSSDREPLELLDLGERTLIKNQDSQ